MAARTFLTILFNLLVIIIVNANLVFATNNKQIIRSPVDQAKRSDMVSIIDFGADPTGSKSSVTAIRLAMKAHDRLYIPSGTYLIDDNLSITSGLVNEGLLSVATNKTLTLLGSFSSDLHLCFTGAGAIKYKNGTEVYPEWWGALPDAATNSTLAIQAAISALSSSTGAVVKFQTGTYLIDKRLTLTNRVGLKGANGRGTTIKPHPDFNDDYMFHAVNGNSSMFGSWLRDFNINARGKNMVAPIWAQAWQETCGLENVVIQFDGKTQSGVLISNGYGGAAYLSFKNIEIFSDSSHNNSCGIKVDQISVVGGFMLDVQGATIAGSVKNPIKNAIYISNDSLRVDGLHVEHCLSGITMTGVGTLTCDVVTGSPSAVVDIITLNPGFTGKVNLSNIMPNGATGAIVRNNKSGNNVPATYGNLPAYIYPAVLSESNALAWVVFRGNGGIGAQDVLSSYNISTVNKTTTGTYNVFFSRMMPNSRRVVTGTINLDSTDGYWISAKGGTSNSETIVVRRGGAYLGATYDAQIVTLVFYGTQVL